MSSFQDLSRDLQIQVLLHVHEMPAHPCCKLFAALYCATDLLSAWLLRWRPQRALFDACMHSLPLTLAVLNTPAGKAMVNDTHEGQGGAWTLLHYICGVRTLSHDLQPSQLTKDNKLQLLSVLLEVPGIDVNLACGALGRTPLWIAIEKDSIEMVQLLMQAPTIQPLQSDRNGQSCLHAVCAFGRHLMLPLVLPTFISAAAVNQQDRQQYTPLHLACFKGHAQVVELLLDCDAVDVSALDFLRRTPLHVAAALGSTAVVDVLLSHIAAQSMSAASRSQLSDSAQPSNQGTCRSHDSAASTCTAAVQPHTGHASTAALDVEARDGSGRTALHLACSYGHLDVVASLLRRSLHPLVNATAVDSRGATPLHVADIDGVRVKVLQCLLDNRTPEELDLNATNHRGETVLFLACDEGDVLTVEMLLRVKSRGFHVDIERANASGISPFEAASNNADGGDSGEHMAILEALQDARITKE